MNKLYLYSTIFSAPEYNIMLWNQPQAICEMNRLLTSNAHENSYVFHECRIAKMNLVYYEGFFFPNQKTRLYSKAGFCDFSLINILLSKHRKSLDEHFISLCPSVSRWAFLMGLHDAYYNITGNHSCFDRRGV